MLFSAQRLLPAALVLTMLSPCAQAEPTFHFDTGVPPWKGERLVLPPGFAPDLGWSGVEQIRFAPGMFQADQPDFFSYVLVFLLAAESEVTEAALKRELLIYYRGLSHAVMTGKEVPVDTSGFSISLAPAEEQTDLPRFAPNVTAWTGTLDWVEPFATQKPQTLQLELHVWDYEGQPVVFSCVSPVDRANAAPWKTLREIRSKFRIGP